MAAVVAKNAVGSSWRKTVGSREWSRVPGAGGWTVAAVERWCCNSARTLHGQAFQHRQSQMPACLPLTRADDEKQYIRGTALAALLGDPSERVALQVSLLITNIARFDAPHPWASLLPDLQAAAAEGSGVAPAGRLRALKALKRVLQALRGKWDGGGSAGVRGGPPRAEPFV